MLTISIKMSEESNQDIMSEGFPLGQREQQKSIQEVGAKGAQSGGLQRKESKERNLILWEIYQRVRRGSIGPLWSCKMEKVPMETDQKPFF
jgi:hypothetical protein